MSKPKKKSKQDQKGKRFYIDIRPLSCPIAGDNSPSRFKLEKLLQDT